MLILFNFAGFVKIPNHGKKKKERFSEKNFKIFSHKNHFSSPCYVSDAILGKENRSLFFRTVFQLEFCKHMGTIRFTSLRIK